MAAPVIAMVGIAAASTIAQFINSERGRALARDERKRLEKLINKLEAPQFDVTELTPPELKDLETYTPEVAEMVYEVAPELVTADSDRAIAGKAAQEAALSRFEAIASGQDPFGDLAVVKAINDAIESSGAQRDAILADMARQGVSPSSSAYGQLQFLQAGQSQKNMFDTALNAAIAERARRDRATSESERIGSDMLRSEIDLERMNDQIINQLNQRNTQARRQYLANRANTLNEAQLTNQRERQRIAEANALAKFQEQQRGQDLRNRQVEVNYRTEFDKLGLQTGNARFPEISERVQGQNQAIQGLSNAAMIGALLSAKQPTKQESPDFGGVGSSEPQYMTPGDREVYLR